MHPRHVSSSGLSLKGLLFHASSSFKPPLLCSSDMTVSLLLVQAVEKHYAC
ncbi:hypothetical protein PAXRUDRAFT_784198 [Paxillus rubicundulus Ve08.2h10]|uniref:Uncharacterized protein n=1 Tax=Paxillus rubicundulus Ve08.2h10 TaxID=930991 RepID=A0A0D0EB30_9AGAM|nr:hypothetical protein PAXRUDRAFT_784198 [Paxillus rubicundulus Ve08.2h10]